tara:strand:- start:213 stop:707 length:495 start_codon:yes stop_codon:yes gene_type:complete
MTFVYKNKTGKSTPNDDVNTNENTAKYIINYFNPKGLFLEPCYGKGAFYNNYQGKKDWCEIKMGKDFFNYKKEVDWIITNPPFSIFDEFLLKSFEISKNIVFFCPLNKVFKGIKLDKKIREYGDIKEILHMGTGSKHGFPFGFSVGCIYYKKNYKGNIKLSRKY